MSAITFNATNSSTYTSYFTRLGRELLSCNVDLLYGTDFNFFYVQNNRGDVILRVGADGNVRVITDYDATGQILSKACYPYDPFGFTGGVDSFGGLWKLGAQC